MRTPFVAALFLVGLLIGCGSSDGTSDGGALRDAPASPDDAGARDAAPGDDDGGPTGATSIDLPADGAEVLFSVAMRVDAPAAASRVEVDVVDHPELTCAATERTFECLLDVSTLPAGPFVVRARSRDAAGAELSSTTRALVRRALVDPCEGMAGDRIDCVLALAAAGTASGFAGTRLTSSSRKARRERSWTRCRSLSSRWARCDRRCARRCATRASSPRWSPRCCDARA